MDAEQSAPGFSPDVIFRIVASLAAEERGRQLGKPLGPADWRRWDRATRLDEDGIGADSLARLELIARVNAFFHMHETGAEDYLVVSPTLGDWADIVGASLKISAERVTFLSSGSTGAPTPNTHALADLAAEAQAHGALFPKVGRVLALTPPHHIYGFLVGCWGPALRGAPALDMRATGPGGIGARALAGDLIVATPFLWSVMLRAGARFAPGVVGVTSGAPAPPELWDDLTEAGLSRLVEIYGSSETGGLGWRDAGTAPFVALDHVKVADGAFTARRDGRRLTPADVIEWTGDGGFRPAGRIDGAVQVGGVNVRCDQVRAALMRHPSVADCAVRLEGDAASARLKGFVVPRAGVDADGLDRTLSAWCAERLTPPERPARFTFGPALPRNEIGKLRDWG
jgi:4-coumarate--CoA ligase (photoactive yellow protein activation family)